MEKYQQTLFPYAYNILGSAEEARDVVGEVLAKYLGKEDTGAIENEKNYLIRSVINLAINTKKRQKRILREGEVWLPEPVATEDAADRNLHLSEVLSYSLLVLLERLGATERAVFILRESFDYTHEEIGAALSLTPEHSRKLLSRAKTKLYKPAAIRNTKQGDHHKEVLQRFIKAIRERDTESLESLMAADIEFHIDGGGKVPLAAGTCKGAAAVSALQMMIYERFLKSAEWVHTTVNHQPALLSFINGRLTSCQVFEVHGEKAAIFGINAVLDPQKLKSFTLKNK